MVEQAASVHALQRLLRHGPGLGLPCAPGVPEQEDQIMRRGEFWRVPEARVYKKRDGYTFRRVL